MDNIVWGQCSSPIVSVTILSNDLLILLVIFFLTLLLQSQWQRCWWWRSFPHCRCSEGQLCFESVEVCAAFAVALISWNISSTYPLSFLHLLKYLLYLYSHSCVSWNISSTYALSFLRLLKYPFYLCSLILASLEISLLPMLSHSCVSSYRYSIMCLFHPFSVPKYCHRLLEILFPNVLVHLLNIFLGCEDRAWVMKGW